MCLTRGHQGTCSDQAPWGAPPSRENVSLRCPQFVAVCSRICKQPRERCGQMNLYIVCGLESRQANRTEAN